MTFKVDTIYVKDNEQVAFDIRTSRFSGIQAEAYERAMSIKMYL